MYIRVLVGFLTAFLMSDGARAQSWSQRLAGFWTVGERGKCALLRYEISDLIGELVLRDQAGQVNVETVLSRRPDTLLTQTVASPQVSVGVRWEYVQEDAATIRVRNLVSGRSFTLLRCTDLAAAQAVNGSARAQAFVRQYFSTWSSDNQTALAFGYAHYMAELLFYGRPTSREAVMAQKETFTRRWPARSYTIVPESLAVKCGRDELECEVSGTVDWNCRSPERNAVSSGTATFGLRIAFQGDAVMIMMETGKVIGRGTFNQPGADTPAPVPTFNPTALPSSPSAGILPEVDVPSPRR